MKRYKEPVLLSNHTLQLGFLQTQYLHCGPAACTTNMASIDLGYSCAGNRLDFFIIDPGASFADCNDRVGLGQGPSCILTATINGSPVILNNLPMLAAEGVTNCFNTLDCDGEILWEGIIEGVDCANLTALTSACSGDPLVTCDDANVL